MPSKQHIQQYLDLMARALCIADQFPAPFQQMAACQKYNQITANADAALDRAWAKGLPAFFTYLKRTLPNIERGQGADHYIRAAAVSLWMDRKICYIATEDPKRFSLYNLLPLNGDRPLCTGAVNSNRAGAGLELYPRYEAARFYDQDADRLRPLGNRDAFEGLNGQLQNICYTRLDSRYAIQHVILPRDFNASTEEGHLRIAFCPMSCRTKLLKWKKAEVQRGGITFNGIWVTGVDDAKDLLARFERDWTSACEQGADIVFGPEMLGMEALEKRSGKYNQVLRRLCLDAMSQKRKPPMLTVLPSLWHDGVNSATLVYQDGTVLGAQPKRTPYVDVNNHRMEALAEQAPWRLLVLHIPGLHRIVVMICADFLAVQSPEMRRFICEGLGATMILAPSYSPGEQDFINLLPSLKSYGTTVVWGDCCGAVKPPRIIGGCSIAGTDDLARFGTECQCGGVCGSRRSCIFLTDLPMRLNRAKPSASPWEPSVKHILH